jgi:hypothetical protein
MSHEHEPWAMRQEADFRESRSQTKPVPRRSGGPPAAKAPSEWLALLAKLPGQVVPPQ